jgi:hypothetical protein
MIGQCLGTTVSYHGFFSRVPAWSTWMCFASVYSFNPSSPNSRPMPLCPYPPKGARPGARRKGLAAERVERRECPFLFPVNELVIDEELVESQAAAGVAPR